MLILLPPSETKREGGVEGSRLRVSELGFRELAAARRRAMTALEELARDPAASARALGLGPRQQAEVLRNLRVRRSPVRPAIDRYDGVLYDALDAPSLPDAARAFAHRHLAIASALFGLTRALDPIPAYRLSADSRLPGVGMRALWSAPVSAIVAREPGLVLDLRSEAYAAFGPAPSRPDSVFVRVVTDEGGRRRALNHFNKAGKGRLVRAMLLAGIDHPDAASLRAWAGDAGFVLEPGAPGELELVV
ncbi:YaaA family protein [Protaetiibacter mangrovi]|uniref:Peroxide stress protein YaaA n=1 Tax=Protaetiibacter mangrovi TaxID=2970926 RepID=A0ABT1ZJ45_9MICO|nr:peroxide stress protein YaaA [Protaetiibacter mangrovi]MCS0500708.1 peroxide stress protein YaaA [Protaetiibacter mangrovi]TPW91046.1 peroxide stress protein YaaA [Schumannella luteola]